MLLVTVSCTILMGLVLSRISYRQRLVTQCENAQWRVFFEFQCNENGKQNIEYDPTTRSVIMPTPDGPEYLRRHLGLAYFNSIRGINLKLLRDADHQLFQQLASQSSLTFLRIEDGEFTERELPTIAALPNLVRLHINVARLTAAQVRDLEAMHPDCELYIRVLEPPGNDSF